MTTIKEYSGVIALIVLAIMGLSGVLKSSAHLAGSTSCGSITCLEGGLRLVSDVGGDFESDVAAVINSTLRVTGLSTLAGVTMSGNLTVTTTNAATSTASVGCVQTVATSTATPVKFIIGSANASASSTVTSVTNQGYVTWAYGTCP